MRATVASTQTEGTSNRRKLEMIHYQRDRHWERLHTPVIRSMFLEINGESLGENEVSIDTQDRVVTKQASTAPPPDKDGEQ